MLKKFKKHFRNKSKLALTPGEEVRDRLIKAGIEAAKNSGYAAGNTTEKVVNLAEKAGSFVDGSTKLVGGAEAAGSLGRIAFKAGKDIARGDTVCTGLCAVSGVCEGVALACSTLTFIPGRGTIYAGAKIISRGCMAYRNLCAGDDC